MASRRALISDSRRCACPPAISFSARMPSRATLHSRGYVTPELQVNRPRNPLRQPWCDYVYRTWSPRCPWRRPNRNCVSVQPHSSRPRGLRVQPSNLPSHSLNVTREPATHHRLRSRNLLLYPQVPATARHFCQKMNSRAEAEPKKGIAWRLNGEGRVRRNRNSHRRGRGGSGDLTHVRLLPGNSRASFSSRPSP